MTGKNDKTKAVQDAGMSTTQVNECPLGFSPKECFSFGCACEHVRTLFPGLQARIACTPLPWTIRAGVSWTL